MTNSQALRRISNVLYIVWGVIHVGIGASTGLIQFSRGSRETLEQMSEILPPETLPQQIPNVVNGVLAQHSWNLTWIGLFAVVMTLLSSRSHNPRWTLIVIAAATEAGLIVSLSVTGFDTLFPIIVGPIIWLLAVSADIGRVAAESSLDDQS